MRGILANTGDGSGNLDLETLDLPDSLHPEVHIKKSVEWLIAAALKMQSEDVWPITLIGSSAGTPAVLDVVATRPDLFTGGVVLISGGSRQASIREDFASRVDTQVLQQYGSEDLPFVEPVMSAMKDDLERFGVDSMTRVYEGQTHGFIARHEPAQQELRDFIKMALYTLSPPNWWLL